MKAVIQGSSKLFYPRDDLHLLMAFKDDIHGANRGGNIAGTGTLRKEFCYYFYRLLELEGIPTHLADVPGTLCNDGIVVKRCLPIKLEILVRNRARGHWVDAHKIPLFEGGQHFDYPIVEFCLKLKNEHFDDPRINPALAIQLHRYAKDQEIRGRMLENQNEVEIIESLALKINSLYQGFMEQEGWILEDFKFEVGLISSGTRTFVLIDEISPDCSRIRDSQGNSLTKDLFRQRRPEEEIYAGYHQLKEAIRANYEQRHELQI